MVLRDIHVDELQALQILAQSASLREAANKFGITESGMSLKLKRLESSVGAPVIEKCGRRLFITGAGQTVLCYAERMISLHYAMQSEALTAANDNEPPLGNLRPRTKSQGRA